MIRRFLAAAALLIASSLPALADVRVPEGGETVYKAECGSCHDVFPPQLLRRDDWRALLAGLDRHFGMNAALSPTEIASVDAYLQRFGADDMDASRRAVELRLTETPFFRRHHGRVPPFAWVDPEVRRPSNCGGCHFGAEQGVFDHEVKLPRRR